jgi:hypothetical protein
MNPAGRVRCNMRTLIGSAGSSGQLTGDGLAAIARVTPTNGSGGTEARNG